MSGSETNSAKSGAKSTGSSTTRSSSTGTSSTRSTTGSSGDTAVRENAITRFFEVTKRRSTLGRELRGGLVTFFTMAYIVVLNPLIIGTQPDSTGHFVGGGTVPDVRLVAAATALV